MNQIFHGVECDVCTQDAPIFVNVRPNAHPDARPTGERCQTAFGHDDGVMYKCPWCLRMFSLRRIYDDAERAK